MQHVTAEDMRDPNISMRIEDFNSKLAERLDDTNFTLAGEDIDYWYPHDVYNIPIKDDAENKNGDIGDPSADRPTGGRRR